MTVVPAPLGNAPVLPPKYFCPNHEGDAYGSPCENCMPTTIADQTEYLREHTKKYREFDLPASIIDPGDFVADYGRVSRVYQRRALIGDSWIHLVEIFFENNQPVLFGAATRLNVFATV